MYSHIANSEAEIPNAATWAPVNDGLRNRRSGSIGCATRASIATKAHSRTAAPPNEARIAGLAQPSSLPRSRPRTSRKSPPVSVTRPGRSTRGARGSSDSATKVRTIHRHASPSGRLMRKIQRQSSAEVSAPPTSGPTANEPPIVAP